MRDKGNSVMNNKSKAIVLSPKSKMGATASQFEMINVIGQL
jgi:hypothetical protein